MFSFLTLEITFYLVLGLGILNIIFFIWLLYFTIRLRKVFRGKNAQSLEDVVQKLIQDTDDLEKFAHKTSAALHAHDLRIAKALRTPEIIRFDAFHGTGEGGKQSFATALVSEDGNGMVLSSMYARDKMRVYAKPVSKFTSEYELTEEEQSVLKGAKK